MEKIISNKAQCLKCGDIIESKSRDELVFCSCGGVGIDGGREFLRRYLAPKYDPNLFQDLSEKQRYSGEVDHDGDSE